MKAVIKGFCAMAVVSILAGCASSGVFVPKVPVKAQMKILEYNERANNKVFILAVDPNGQFAYGSASGKSTLKEAAKVAVKMCDEGRVSKGITGKPYIYAINGKVVYKDMIQKDQGAK